MQTFKLIISTPEKKLFEGEADSVAVPGQEGRMTILPGHAPLLSTLSSGDVTVSAGSGEETFRIDGGFIEVNEDGVTVLAKNAPS